MKKSIKARYDLILKPALEKVLSYQRRKIDPLTMLAKENAKILDSLTLLIKVLSS